MSTIVAPVVVLHGAPLLAAFLSLATTMVWGTPPQGVKRGEGWDIGHVPLIVTGLALAGFGLVLPDPLKTLLDRAVSILLVR